MPSINIARKLAKTNNGRARKIQSDNIIEATWWEDISSQVAYLYDYYHDDYKTQLCDLDPVNDEKKVAIDIKYIIASSQTMAKDAVTYHLQMRPSQVCNVDYYDEFFKKRYGSEFPVGLYVDIMDNHGVYNKWLVVAKANFYDPMYSTFEILPCDKVFQWIHDGIKYEMSGVLRSQNSYVIVRFIVATLYQKSFNCREPLKFFILQRNDEISIVVNVLKNKEIGISAAKVRIEQGSTTSRDA